MGSESVGQDCVASAFETFDAEYYRHVLDFMRTEIGALEDHLRSLRSELDTTRLAVRRREAGTTGERITELEQCIEQIYAAMTRGGRVPPGRSEEVRSICRKALRLD
jgi:hypothetical protein